MNDNDSTRDRHWLPRDERGVTDWPAVERAIALSPYHRPFQLEVISDRKYPSRADFLTTARNRLLEIERAVQRLRSANPIEDK